MALHDEVVRAGVVAGGVDTRYLGTGRGAPVLVLTDDPARRAVLLEHFPRGLRIIAPDLHKGPHEWVAWRDDPAWLASFLDALGLWRVAVVADAALAATSVAMALAAPGRVASLVLLQNGLVSEGQDEDGFDAQTGLLTSGIPLLAVWVGAGDAGSLTRTLPRIADFLATPRAED